MKEKRGEKPLKNIHHIVTSSLIYYHKKEEEARREYYTHTYKNNKNDERG